MSKPHLNVGELLRLNKHHFKPSLFLVFICVFRSLNCDKNGLRHKYFSVKVMFSNYFVTKYRLPMLSQAQSKTTGTEIFLISQTYKEKKQVWQILYNFTKVDGFLALSNGRHQSTIKVHPYISRILQISFTQMFLHFL